MARNISRGANLLPICVTLDFEPFHCTLKVISRWQPMERPPVAHTAAGLCCLVRSSAWKLRTVSEADGWRPCWKTNGRRVILHLAPRFSHRWTFVPIIPTAVPTKPPKGPSQLLWTSRRSRLEDRKNSPAPNILLKGFFFSFYPFNISCLSITCHNINLILLKIH